jgi:phage anti-repressor protein
MGATNRLSKQDLVKLFTTIPHDFVDDFYTILDTNNDVKTPFPIHLDVLAKWLNIPKSYIMKTLRDSYRIDDDYIVEKTYNTDQRKKGSGGHNKHKVMLTVDTFKRLCMRSRTKKAEDVRTYFIELDDFVTTYKNEILDALLKKLNNKRHGRDGQGWIYVFRVKGDILKIGYTEDLLQRLRNYMVGRVDDIDILASFKTSDRKKVEQCVKTFCQAKRYTPRKELYKVDENIIKRVMKLCVNIGDTTIHSGKLSVTSKGNYYIFIDDVDSKK